MTEDFPLTYPVEVQGQTYDGLKLRRPKGRDMELMEKATGPNTTKSFQLLASLAQVDINVIRELDPEDLDRLNDWLEPILDPKGRASRDAGR